MRSLNWIRGFRPDGPHNIAHRVHQLADEAYVTIASNRVFLGFFILSTFALGQSVSISIGSGSGTAGGTISLPVNLNSLGGALPAGVQWSFSYTSDITSVTVVAGSAASAAGKSVSCNGNICLAAGLNQNTISNGTVATATFQLAANPSTTTIPIQVIGVVASTLTGSAISASGVSGSVSMPPRGRIELGYLLKSDDRHTWQYALFGHSEFRGPFDRIPGPTLKQ